MLSFPEGWRGRTGLPRETSLHLFDLDALIRTDFDAAHAADALAGVHGVRLVVVPHLVDLDRADVDALAATRTTFEVYIYQIH